MEDDSNLRQKIFLEKIAQEIGFPATPNSGNDFDLPVPLPGNQFFQILIAFYDHGTPHALKSFIGFRLYLSINITFFPSLSSRLLKSLTGFRAYLSMIQRIHRKLYPVVCAQTPFCQALFLCTARPVQPAPRSANVGPFVRGCGHILWRDRVRWGHKINA